MHTHDEERNERIRYLLTDNTAMKALFEQIAGKQESQVGRINNTDQISLVEVITFFNGSTDPCFQGFGAHANIAKQALRYTEKHSKKKKKYKDQISQKQFKVFLPTMFLFAHLWEIFESHLDNDIDDKRIFKHEFIKCRSSVQNLTGVTISDEVTDKMWVDEFDTIDVNKNGFISFGEFCSYATKYIATPIQFVEDIMNEKHAMYEEDEENKTSNDDFSFNDTTDDAPSDTISAQQVNLSADEGQQQQMEKGGKADIVNEAGEADSSPTTSPMVEGVVVEINHTTSMKVVDEHAS